MPATEPDMPKRSGRPRPRGPAAGSNRFDGESARRILQRAAAEQQRLNSVLADSYTFEELEEMAAEAGISPEALRAAVEAHARGSGTAAVGTSLLPEDRPRRRRASLERLTPGRWSTAVKGIVLTTAGGIGFVGLLLAFPAVAQAVLWALLAFLVLLAVLIALGASPL